MRNIFYPFSTYLQLCENLPLNFYLKQKNINFPFKHKAFSKARVENHNCCAVIRNYGYIETSSHKNHLVFKAQKKRTPPSAFILTRIFLNALIFHLPAGFALHEDLDTYKNVCVFFFCHTTKKVTQDHRAAFCCN